MKISMARGDLHSIPFGVYVDEELYAEEMDDIYFTVKRHHYDREFIFQKRVSDGSIATDGQGSYVVKILPEDTNGLQLGMYDFDFEVVRMPNIKRTFAGTLELTKEVTHYYNEGA